MHVIEHNHKSDTTCRLKPKLLIQDSQQDLLWVIVVEKISTAITSERDEVSPEFTIENVSFVRHQLVVTTFVQDRTNARDD